MGEVTESPCDLVAVVEWCLCLSGLVSTGLAA